MQQRFDAPEIKLKISREKASDVGLNPDEVVKNVVSAVSNSSTYNFSIWVDPKTGIDYPFGVQYPEESLFQFRHADEHPHHRPRSGTQRSFTENRGDDELKAPMSSITKTSSPC